MRRLREHQGAIDQAETPRPEPEPAAEEAAADIPAPPPSGVGFAVVVPLRGPDERRPFLATMKDVLELIPASIPATWVQAEPGGVLLWYAVSDAPLSEADQQPAIETIWRVQTCMRRRAAARGWVLPQQALRLQATPTDSATAVSAGSSGRVYTLPELQTLLDGAGASTREDEERQTAEWRARFDSPDLVVNPQAELPGDVLDRLMEDPLFLATWLRQRRDLPDKNEAHDRALASILKGHGLDDQMVMDGIVHHRRLHGKKMDVREDYFNRILSQEFRDTAKPATGTSQPRTPRKNRRQFSVAASDRDQVVIEELARRAGHTVSNYFRMLAGLPPIYPGRRNPIEREDYEEAIEHKFLELGLDPTNYFTED